MKSTGKKTGNENKKMFTKETKIIKTDFPRITLNSTIPNGVELDVVIDLYKADRKDVRLEKECRPLNIYFMSGTGMPKSIWGYHIERLFKYSSKHQGEISWRLENCVTMDIVNHGESGVLNRNKLGANFDWKEGSLDLITVVEELNLVGDNVLIGHSMGGFQALFASALKPKLFKFVIAIEPVLLYERSQVIAFKQRVPMVNYKIKDEFNSEEEYVNYFKNKSFYKKFKDRILKDFIDAEKYTDKNGKIRTKTSKVQQMICYLQVQLLVPYSKDILNNIKVPVVHIVGLGANWNHPDTVKFIRDNIKHLQPVDIPNGGHLLHCEAGTETMVIDTMIDSINKNIGTDENEEQCEPETTDHSQYVELEYRKLFGAFMQAKM